MRRIALRQFIGPMMSPNISRRKGEAIDTACNETIDLSGPAPILKDMRQIAALLSVVFVLFSAPACEENLDPATPEGAMHQLREAVDSSDTAAILGASSKKTSELLAQMHALLVEQRRMIAEKYPKDQAAGARAYPAGVLEAENSLALFEALIGPELEALKHGPGLKHGMTTRGSPSGDTARQVVPTHSNESVEFVFEDGKWKVTAFEHNLATNLQAVILNQGTFEENLRVFAELKRREIAAKAKAAESAAKP